MDDDILEKRTKSPTIHWTIFVTSSIFISILIVSLTFRIEIVAEGIGKIVPITRVQVIQPEYSGAVIKINVNNGDIVKQGDVLILLDSTESSTELATLKAEQKRLLIEQKRIQALLNIMAVGNYTNPIDAVNQYFNIDADLQKLAFFKEQKKLIISDIKNYSNQETQIKERIEVNKYSIEINQSNIERAKLSIEFRQEILNTTSNLVKNNVKAEIELDEAKQNLLDIENQYQIFIKEKSQNISRDDELNTELKTLKSSTRNTLLQRLNDIEQRMATLNEQQHALKRRVAASTIIAPVSGTVTQLNIFTIGGIAQGGDEILRIVPENSKVEFEGVISNEQSGMLELGQKVNIRIDAFPSERFGFVKGTLTDISADSVDTGDGRWGFVVRVTPNKYYLSSADIQHPLKNGMTGSVNVVTGKRLLITYFFAPIVKTLQDSMGER